MAERSNDSDKVVDNDNEKSLEEKYAATERAIAQAENDREKLWPMIRDFNVARSSLFRILSRG